MRVAPRTCMHGARLPWLVHSIKCEAKQSHSKALEESILAAPTDLHVAKPLGAVEDAADPVVELGEIVGLDVEHEFAVGDAKVSRKGQVVGAEEGYGDAALKNGPVQPCRVLRRPRRAHAEYRPRHVRVSLLRIAEQPASQQVVKGNNKAARWFSPERLYLHDCPPCHPC